MRSPTVIVVFLVGATAVAAAQPNRESTPKTSETGARLRYGDEAPPPKPRAPAPTSGWLEIASPTPSSHGTEFIVVGAKAGRFAQLRVDATQGTTVIRRVRVYFTDGTQKVVYVDRKLSTKRNAAKSTIIELGKPKPIDRVIVTTETYTKGSYAIYGSAGPQSVAGRK